MTNTSNINFVAAWSASTGSISVLVKQDIPNLLLMSTGKGGAMKTCIQTFSKEKFAELGLPAETVAQVHTATAKTPVKFDPIPVKNFFKMDCKVQILEAIGIEAALKLGILNRDKKTGEIKGVDNAQKRDRESKELVFLNGEPVFRKCRLVPDTDQYQDALVSTVSENKPLPPTGADESDDDAASAEIPF